MPSDPSIIMGYQPPQFQSPLDAMGKALTMKTLAQNAQVQSQAFNDDQAMRSAFANNTTPGPDGTPVVNRAGVLSYLARTAPMKAIEQSRAFTQQDAAQREQQMKTLNDQVQIGQTLLNQIPIGSGATPEEKQAAWSKMKELGNKFGLPNGDQLPDIYPGDDHVKFMQGNLLTAKEKLDQHNKEIDQANQQRKTDIEAYAAGVPGAMGSAPRTAVIDPNTDPATLVNRMVQPKEREKAFEEIKDNQNIAKIAAPSLAAFDQAAKEVRPMSGGITGTSGTAFVPGLDSPGQKAWQGMANTTVKDVEGTARQAAFESLAKNFKPQFGDSDANIAKKREGWINYLTSHAAAPVTKGNGIDLSKYKSTTFDLGNQNKYTPTKEEALAELQRRQQAKTAGNN